MSGLTIDDLVAMEQLGCTVIAGADGGRRRVVWAHSCELEDPWNWVGADELLMTVGMCVPRDDAAQVRFVRRLREHGVAGVAIGDDLKGPPISAAMAAEADRLAFPVITVSHTIPFAALGRTVALASQSGQIRRIARLSRLYELARTATFGDASLLSRLSAELGHRLHVVDVRYASEVMREGQPLARGVVEELADRLCGQLDRLPARINLESDGAVTATALALSTHRACMLVAEGPGEVDVDVFVLLHAQSLIAMEVERITRDRERADLDGEEIFRQVIHGTLGLDAAQLSLRQVGLAAAEPLTVVGFDAAHLPTVRLLMGDAPLPHLSCELGEHGFLMVLTADAGEAVELLTPHVPALGISASSSSLQHVGDSTRQASWALQAAHAAGGGVADYTTAAPLFLPRTLADAHFATRMILGSLMEHDEAHGSDLVNTLEVFLSTDRSWVESSRRLMIHRQTLGYRLRKIETLSGRSTRGSADIAMFWMALVARRITREAE
ncbi:MAG: putative purine catabolism regulatory protein [Nocardioides sp.]|jgi:purine catabolism regulator|nr:putative purine catabolism regulatory protein [Nocardioides sp.]